MEPRITTITLGVSDLTRSIRFYRDGLGFPAKIDEGSPIAFFTTHGTRLALYSLDRLGDYVGQPAAKPGSPFGEITLGHNVRSREEVSEVLSLAEKAGGRILKPAQQVFWGGISGIFADPDGHVWEVAWAPMFSFDETGALVF